MVPLLRSLYLNLARDEESCEVAADFRFRASRSGFRGGRIDKIGVRGFEGLHTESALSRGLDGWLP